VSGRRKNGGTWTRGAEGGAPCKKKEKKQGIKKNWGVGRGSQRARGWPIPWVNKEEWRKTCFAKKKEREGAQATKEP